MLGTEAMIQVDVPKGANEISHSRLFNPKAIFSLTPTSESWCRAFATRSTITSSPLLPYVQTISPVQREINDGSSADPDQINY